MPVHALAFLRDPWNHQGLIKGFCLGQQKPDGSLNCFSLTQDASLSPFSPPLLAAGASPKFRTGTATYLSLQSLLSLAWVRHLIGEPRGGHGMGKEVD